MAQHGSLAVALTAREALVRSAAELFARSGFDGVSVREINRQAGLSAAAAHYHFNSKEVLFQEVLTRGTELVKPRMAARLTELNARSKPHHRHCLFGRWPRRTASCWKTIQSTANIGCRSCPTSAISSLRRWTARLSH